MYGQIYGKTLVVGRSRPWLVRRIENAVGVAFDRFLAWQERARSRRLLRGLDDHMLHDIGIDRSTAEQEGSTPFWR